MYGLYLDFDWNNFWDNLKNLNGLIFDIKELYLCVRNNTDTVTLLKSSYFWVHTEIFMDQMIQCLGFAL